MTTHPETERVSTTEEEDVNTAAVIQNEFPPILYAVIAALVTVIITALVATVIFTLIKKFSWKHHSICPSEELDEGKEQEQQPESSQDDNSDSIRDKNEMEDEQKSQSDRYELKNTDPAKKENL